MPQTRKKSLMLSPRNGVLFVVFTALVLAAGYLLGTFVSSNRTNFLFIQEATSGTFTPKENGTYEITLEGVSDGTLYFSDRPKRVVGSSDTSTFLSTWGEGRGNFAEDPPNAVLVTNYGNVDEEDAIVVELTSPSYNRDTATLTYNATVLGGSFIGGLSSENRREASDFPETLTKPVLFIDSCCSFTGCSFTC